MYENSLQLALTEKNVIENFKWTEQQMASLSQITCICIGTNEAGKSQLQISIEQKLSQ